MGSKTEWTTCKLSLEGFFLKIKKNQTPTKAHEKFPFAFACQYNRVKQSINQAYLVAMKKESKNTGTIGCFFFHIHRPADISIMSQSTF